MKAKIECEVCKKSKTRDLYTARAKKSMAPKICLFCRQNVGVQSDLKLKKIPVIMDRSIKQSCLGLDCNSKFDTTVGGSRFCHKCQEKKKSSKLRPDSVSNMLNGTWSF